MRRLRASIYFYFLSSRLWQKAAAPPLSLPGFSFFWLLDVFMAVLCVYKLYNRINRIQQKSIELNRNQ